MILRHTQPVDRLEQAHRDGPDSPCTIVDLDLGVGLRRLFLIWNRGYRIFCVVAVDTSEALTIAAECKHVKRVGAYRRFEDVTDKVLAGEGVDHVGVLPNAETVLNTGRSGPLTWNDDGIYLIAGQPVGNDSGS